MTSAPDYESLTGVWTPFEDVETPHVATSRRFWTFYTTVGTAVESVVQVAFEVQ